MASAGAKALSYWKQLEKENIDKSKEKLKYNFKISRRRKNTLGRKRVKALKEQTKDQPVNVEEKDDATPAVPAQKDYPIVTKPEVISTPEQPQPEKKHVPTADEPKDAKKEIPVQPSASLSPPPSPKEVIDKEVPAKEEVTAVETVVETSKTEAVMSKEQASPTDESEDPFPCKVKYDFGASEATELSVKAGDTVMILQISETGWCLAQRGDFSEGWVPMDYLERIEDERIEGEKQAEYKKNLQAQDSKTKVTPIEPKRVSPLGEENQKLFDYLTTSQLFQQARSTGEMKVNIEDLHSTLAAGGGVDATLAYMCWLDVQKRQLANFAALQTEIKKLKASWGEHRLILKMKMKWSDVESTQVMQQGLGGLETLDILKGYEGTAEGAIKHIIEQKEAKKQLEEKGRSAVLDYLSTPECSLFQENCSVTQTALDALFFAKSPSEVMAKVKALNEEKKSFASFEALVEAVSGKKVKSQKGNDNKSFQPVLQYLSSPQCNLFRGSTGLRVTSNEIRMLLDKYDTDVQRLLCDVSILNVLGVQLKKFSELATSLDNKEVSEYKAKLFNIIKDPSSGLFATIPEEFPEDELYEVIAVSTSKIDFLPLILKNLPEKADSLDDLATNLEEIITKMESNEAAEQAAVVGFLSKFGLFSKQFPITAPDCQKLIWTSQFSKWGLKDGSVEDILKALHEGSSVFDSFEGLIKAVAEKAEKLGGAI